MKSQTMIVIISLVNPRASELISALNRGLQRLRVNGKIGQYLQEIGL